MDAKLIVFVSTVGAVQLLILIPTMAKAKVLVVNGTVGMRKRIGDAVKADAGLELAGVAQNASIARQKVKLDRPDCIVLDSDLEDVDIFELVRELAKSLPDTRIVLFGTTVAQGSACVLDFISAGASDYLLKPDCRSASDPALDCIERDLIPKLGGKVASPAVRKEVAVKSLLGGTLAVGNLIRHTVRFAEKKDRVKKFRGTFEVLCIGSSTGGPNALAQVFSRFEKNFPVPILITQHMPPMFTAMLATRLNGLNTVTFHEASDGMLAERGNAYIAPGGKHMTVVKVEGRLKIKLNEDPPENSCRPAVDVMLRSVANCVGGAALVTILTGMGKDGCLGCDHLSDLGATVYAQDEETSVVWGMPGFVSAEGIADKVLPLDQISDNIHRAFHCSLPPTRV